jgi:hypothetical protein
VDKIGITREGSTLYLSYKDYPEKRQLKDFYKLYKKASGYIVTEYREENDSVLAITGNETSVLIGHDAEHGCFVRSDLKDVGELVDDAFGMLCYRYSGYSGYDDVSGNREGKSMDGLLELAREKHEETSDDEGTYDDVVALLKLSFLTA